MLSRAKLKKISTKQPNPCHPRHQLGPPTVQAVWAAALHQAHRRKAARMTLLCIKK
jgi:hypothetical protein